MKKHHFAGYSAKMIEPVGQPENQEEVDSQHIIGERDHQSDTNDYENGNFYTGFSNCANETFNRSIVHQC